jgi:uncharacterized repeat protein (TIGR03803 family)
MAALALGSGGVLYGTTLYGYGTVFSLAPPSPPGSLWTETVLYYFTGGADGSMPLGSVAVGSDGVLYTTSSTADPTNDPTGAGAVISLAPPVHAGDPWTPAVLYDFNFASGGGSEPHSGVVVGAGGALYGTTTTGGGCLYEYGCGTVYSLLPAPPNTETPLYDFQGNGGVEPSAVVADSAGVLYGTVWSETEYHKGQIKYSSYAYSVSPPADSGGPWTEAEIYRFKTGSDPLGYLPLAGVVIGDGGVLYGTTSAGGAYGSGAVFSLAPPASPGGPWTGTALYNFPKESHAISPGGLVYDSARGILYGVTLSGGSYGKGTAFALTPPSSPEGAWTYRVLHVFTGGSDGAGPNTLVIGSGGFLYGATQVGGAYYSGTVFSLRP